MSKQLGLQWTTRFKAVVNTSSTTLQVQLKRPYKGAMCYNLFVDGVNTGILDTEVTELTEKTKRYFEGYHKL